MHSIYRQLFLHSARMCSRNNSVYPTLSLSLSTSRFILYHCLTLPDFCCAFHFEVLLSTFQNTKTISRHTINFSLFLFCVTALWEDLFLWLLKKDIERTLRTDPWMRWQWRRRLSILKRRTQLTARSNNGKMNDTVTTQCQTEQNARSAFLSKTGGQENGKTHWPSTSTWPTRCISLLHSFIK